MDEQVTQLDSDTRAKLAERGRSSLFFFDKAILGYDKMTEACHGPLCVFVDRNGMRFKLILMPRDHYKTTVVTVGSSMQKAVRNPNERILIANESATNAERMLRIIRQHCESNRVFRALYPEVIPKDSRKVRWNDRELDFIRTEIFPEPTFDTIGMTGAVTSRHYSHIVYDDPISEEAVKSEKVMQDTISRMSGALSLLTRPEEDSIWFVGTRWALHDVYSHAMEMYGPKLAKFIRGAIEDGLPIFPELISLETLALKRFIQGEYRFSCLMMNNPRNNELQDFNVDDLKFFSFTHDGERVVLYDRQGKPERSYRVEDLDITCTVDPAPAEKITSDRNAISVTGTTPLGEAIVLESWGQRCTPLELIEKLFQVKERWHPRVYGIEGVAYQKALKYFVKAEASRRNTYLNIVELKAQGKKELRIRSLQPVLATGRLYVEPTQMLLRQEMADFPLGKHDDVLEALSMQTQVWRGLMSAERWAKYKESERKLISGELGHSGLAEYSKRVALPKRAPIEMDLDEVEEARLARTRPVGQPAWLDHVIT